LGYRKDGHDHKCEHNHHDDHSHKHDHHEKEHEHHHEHDHHEKDHDHHKHDHPSGETSSAAHHHDDMPAWKKAALEADPMAAPFGGSWTTEASLSATADKMEE
jgi:hypothetical protein